jgi:hypothetical protein
VPASAAIALLGCLLAVTGCSGGSGSPTTGLEDPSAAAGTPNSAASPLPPTTTVHAQGVSTAQPLYTDPAAPPVPFGSVAPFQMQTYPPSWQDSTLINYITTTSAGTLTSTPQTSGGKPQGTLLSRDWTNTADSLKYSASIDKDTAGQVVIIQCYVSGKRITDGTGFLASCLGDSVPTAQAPAARSWATTQAKDLIADIIGSPSQTFTSPQPVFGDTRVVVRSNMNLAENPSVPVLLLYITAASGR